ncbi:uncharacterized protein LOC116291797 isoform X2 [Actinia tenebrosa]|uniref:Uncharacterized protein LOC116291797 isoform X2 n=1 Tax=Actinia tenebrosa TaxID=6105 RepID=A0A6P8HEM0_ACTTE|nr:uncharacterized protein LOC116291797 isoform X2 [Actinia tenebrosa]
MRRALVFANFSFFALLLSCQLIQGEAAVTTKARSTSTTLRPTSSSVETSPRFTTPYKELTTVQPNDTAHTHAFVPKVCEVNALNNSSRKQEEGNVHWLASSPVLISQENTPIDLKCHFCLIKPMTWTKVLWYKDDKPIKNVQTGTFHISHPRNNADEGVYKCNVVTPDNQTASLTMTLIINKDSRFSTIPSIWIRNETFSQSTFMSWLVRGHGIFDSVKLIVKIRRLDSPIWEYKRYYVQYISGSTELRDLIPSTQYMVNITAVNSDGIKEECRCVIFWSNAWNSTGYNCGFLGLDLSTRRTLGLVFGALGLLFTISAIYCCIVHQACDVVHSHEGYEQPDDQQQYENKDDDCGLTNNYKDSGSLYSSNSQNQIINL